MIHPTKCKKHSNVYALQNFTLLMLLSQSMHHITFLEFTFMELKNYAFACVLESFWLRFKYAIFPSKVIP